MFYKKNIDNLVVNTLRFLSADMVERAGSGHPGAPMGMAPLAYVLWKDFLSFNPHDSTWMNRDRFVLSAGHASALLYSLLHCFDFDLPMSELKKFRQWGSKTPGHPEYELTFGVEATTGPLGQGFGMAVGMSLGARFLAQRYNQTRFKIFNYNVWAFVSDGDLMEGVSHEVASLAGQWKLDNLICVYDSNKTSIEGSTDLVFRDDTAKRFQSYGWEVLRIHNSNGLKEVKNIFQKARLVKNKPCLVIADTIIGYGAPHKAGTAAAHGEPLGIDELAAAKKNLGWDASQDFFVPAEVKKLLQKVARKKELQARAWDKLIEKYKTRFKDLGKEIDDLIKKGKIELDIQKIKSDEKNISTREASGKILNSIAQNNPCIIGGSADLAPSTKTWLNGFGDLGANEKNGRNLHFGVREHAMGCVLNGLVTLGGIIPYGGTFLVFTDYMRPAMRIASLMRLRVIYVLTHDSIALGEDGPTHQPVEHLASLRAMPNLTVIRPADFEETFYSWEYALKNISGPTALILTRQKLPAIDGQKYAGAIGVRRGAYVLNPQVKKFSLIMIATGSEVSLAVEAAEKLSQKGIFARIVSMPSREIFEKQSLAYREKVLPKSTQKRIIIEAASGFGWEKYAGNQGVIISIDKFGASAPGEVVMKKYGFTVENIVKQILKMSRRV